MRADAPALVPRIVALGIVLLATLILAAPARARLQVRPGRELLRDDVLALTVQRAGSIVVGRGISRHDTTVQRGEHSGAVTFQKVRFASQRALKGPRARHSLAFCSLPAGMIVATRSSVGQRSAERAGPPGTFILFLHRPQDDQDAPSYTYRGALQRSCEWIAIEDWSTSYFLPGASPWTKDLEAEVRRAVARQSIGALIRRADRIVLGRILPHSGHRAVAGSGYGSAPRTIAVARTLKGPHRARLDVQPVVPFWNQPDGWATEGKREFLWLLRRTRGGALEPVELLAGIVEVRGGRVPAWDMSLDAAIDQIRSVRPR